MTLKLVLQDKFALSRDGQPIDLRSKKAQALLIYLVLTGKPHSREHLATLLWGDRYDDQARRSLRQALHALRKAVGPDVVVGEDHLRLMDAAVELDAFASSETGRLLPDFRSNSEAFDDWLTNERSSRSRKTITSLIHDAEASLAQHDDPGALACYQRALALDPANEAVLRQVMEILGRLDRRAEAMQHFEQFRSTLRADLDADPATETLALVASLRESPQPAEPDTDHPNALILPFEDLGGGEMATFIGRDMQDEINARLRALGIVVVDLSQGSAVEIGGHDALLAHARKIGAQSIVTGSVRQIGDNVRMTLRILSPDEGTSVWTHRTIINTDDAFERIADVGSVAAQSLSDYLARYRSSAELVQRLKSEIDRPDAFLATWVNLYWKAFFVEQTRHHLRDVNELCVFANKKFPNRVEVVVSRAIALFHCAHVSDDKDRQKHYREAADILEQAVSLDPSQSWVRMGQIIINTWLGRFEVVDRVYRTMLDEASVMHSGPGLRLPSLAFRDMNDEAIASVGIVMKNEAGSPLLFYRFSYLGLAHFNKGDFSMALRQAQSALDSGREFFMGHLVKIAALERMGRHEDAVRALEEMRLDYRDPTVSEFDFLPFTDPARKAALMDALRDAGMPE